MLGLACLVLGVLVLAREDERWLPALTVPLVWGSLALSTRSFLAFEGGLAAAALLSTVFLELTPLALTTAAVLAVLAVLMTVLSPRGQAHPSRESILTDLRDALQTQSELPEIPPGWSGQAVTRSAGNVQFAGDFVLAANTHSAQLLELVVVDVSGHGLAAGARTLQLSGALGGLLGALPPQQFLPAANSYLLRQDWAEGFATAVYLTLRWDTGEFELRSAGHPPAVQLHAGSGKWRLLAASGPALGIVGWTDFVPVHGRLQAGDALMLFTDGLIETSERDFTRGIDKLVGEAERMVKHGLSGGAVRLADRLEAASDDRTLVLLNRH
jgi:hypothetical protein